MAYELISTETCFEGYNASEDCHVTDTYSGLQENPAVDDETIAFSEWAWDHSKDFFKDELDEVIRSYEKQYRTNVVKIALAGKIGLWNGSPIGGRFISADSNPLEYMGRVEEIEVKLETDGTVSILGHHHDGKHRMNLYLLTERVYENIQHWDYEAFEWIVENRKPIKMRKLAKSKVN